jgi:hypothetical protein
MHKVQESRYCSCTGRSSEKIYVAAVEAALRGKRKDRMKLSLPPKLMVFSVSTPP